MTDVKFKVEERANGVKNVVRNCEDWSEAYNLCEAKVKEWSDAGFIVDTYDGEFMAHDPESYDLVHDYLITYEYIPQVGAINPAIKGYEFVKNVVFCGGSERTGDNMLFVFKRNVDNELHALCEVAERTRESLADLEARYPEDEYVIHWGCIITLPKGAAVLPSGGDIIDLYLS